MVLGAVTCSHAGRKIDWISDISRGSRVQTIRALEVKVDSTFIAYKIKRKERKKGDKAYFANLCG